MSAISAAPTAWTIRSSARKRTSPARLQSIAEPGQIILSYETYALVRDMLSGHALEPIRMKGIAHPVVPYAVDGVLGDEGVTHKLFSEHMPGLDLYLDPSAMNEDGAARVKALLQQALDSIEAGRRRRPASAGYVAAERECPLRIAMIGAGAMGSVFGVALGARRCRSGACSIPTARISKQSRLAGCMSRRPMVRRHCDLARPRMQRRLARPISR